jgi:hypothetical protein
MASLHAPASPRGVGIPFNRFLSLLTFVVIFVAGWIAVSYLKSQIAGEESTSQTALAAVPASTPEQRTPAGGQSKAEPTLVYASGGDSTHFHTSTHVPTNLERTALSEETARARGLKPCPVCMRQGK